MDAIGYLLARFSEPSSYAGLGAVLALAGLHFSDTDLGQIAQFLAAGCGLAALLLKERGMIPVLALAVLAATTLGACSRSIPSTAAMQTDARAVLTTTQQAMCEAQSAANLANAVAAAVGEASAASSAAKASAAAGAGCTWSSTAASSQ